jgi:hypothetical protein
MKFFVDIKPLIKQTLKQMNFIVRDLCMTLVDIFDFLPHLLITNPDLCINNL